MTNTGDRFLLSRLTALCFGLVLSIVIVSVPVPAAAESSSILHVGKFSAASVSENHPPAWQPLTFKKIKTHTHYTLVEDQNRVVLRAESDNSSSGLVRKIAINPKEYPIIEWSWKVGNILKNGNATKKSGDDYPARIYIAFAYDKDKIKGLAKAKYRLAKLAQGEYPPLGALNYIWGSNSQLGAILPNPYTDRVQMIVVESGTAKVGQWVTESRNIYEDYRTAFGEEPPHISAVAVMTDTDNTHEKAVAWFGDIVFREGL